MKFVRRPYKCIVNMFYFLLSSLSQGSGYPLNLSHAWCMYSSNWGEPLRTENRDQSSYRWLLYVHAYFVQLYIIIDNCVTQCNRKICCGKNNIEYIRIIQYIEIHMYSTPCEYCNTYSIYFAMTAIVRNSIAIIYFSVTLVVPSLLSLLCCCVFCVDGWSLSVFS